MWTRSAFRESEKARTIEAAARKAVAQAQLGAAVAGTEEVEVDEDGDGEEEAAVEWQ